MYVCRVPERSDSEPQRWRGGLEGGCRRVERREKAYLRREGEVGAGEDTGTPLHSICMYVWRDTKKNSTAVKMQTQRNEAEYQRSMAAVDNSILDLLPKVVAILIHTYIHTYILFSPYIYFYIANN